MYFFHLVASIVQHAACYYDVLSNHMFLAWSERHKTKTETLPFDSPSIFLPFRMKKETIARPHDPFSCTTSSHDFIYSYMCEANNMNDSKHHNHASKFSSKLMIIHRSFSWLPCTSVEYYRSGINYNKYDIIFHILIALEKHSSE